VRSTLRRLFLLIGPRQQRYLAGLVAVIAASGLVDTLGAVSILPLLALLAAPDVALAQFPFPMLSSLTGLNAPHDLLVFICVLSLTLILVGQGLRAASSYLSARFARQQELLLAVRLFRNRLAGRYETFLHRNATELGRTTLGDAELLVQGFVAPLLQVVAQGLVLVCIGALLVLVNPIAALSMATAIGGSYGLILWSTRAYLRKIGKERHASAAARSKAVHEAYFGIKETKLRGAEPYFLEQMEKHSRVYAKHQATASVLSEIPRFGLEAIVFGVIIVMLLLLLNEPGRALANVLPTMGLFAFAGVRLFPALQLLYAALNTLNFNREVLDRLEPEFAMLEPPMLEKAEDYSPIPLKKEVRLVDASYHYPQTQRASIERVSMVIPALATVGIVGATGAGKTTLVDILLGLLSPHQGSLEVDGVKITGELCRRWQRSIGYVPQSIFLADDTIRANIALGIEPNCIDDDRVRRAARLAQLDDYVMRQLPQGYATVVGDRGILLSGGQRQRIGIARALYHDPDLVVFDEATSALDPQTEGAVMDAIFNAGRAKTAIIISHRLSSVRQCDMIFVLDDGRCVASGTYQELMQAGGRFGELFADRSAASMTC